MPDTVKKYSNDEIRKLLEEVTDPEIPVLNVVEMGIVRGIKYDDKDRLVIEITPTYSGCPAMKVIENEIKKTLDKHGITDAIVKTDFTEAWTTNWLTDEAKRKLKEYGIAPPEKISDEELLFEAQKTRIVPCPYCDSLNTELQAEFGSTACKALYFCKECNQPFEHFKCH
jgi:ring-1,2-phenylacetyl-CoA epoxidase subunit PaaD